MNHGDALYVEQDVHNIHVPFCHTKCPYCDFNTFQGIDDLKGPYVDAMVRELEMWGHLV